ncbi:hypothetical protein KIH31_14310 [Paenarthrobacter sp. DKR-5]|uniref:hypothetical protein n=1 Tax=Paenarthrobacter sp. DKR-5 TaxID=2835535 RepID=UPI001BDDAB69|nr:hypothetical protein [Paenarthrobacter sp. DKR-5]MBT1003774.1 hypothetical protein [Paenarthrobacter sp. DKR-5]
MSVTDVSEQLLSAAIELENAARDPQSYPEYPAIRTNVATALETIARALVEFEAAGDGASARSTEWSAKLGDVASGLTG